MHGLSYFILSLAGLALSLPLFRAEHGRRDSIISISPIVEPNITIGGDNSCVGIGISVCDPITVNSTTTETTNKPNSKAAAPATPAQPSDSPISSADSLVNTATSTGDSLINLSSSTKGDSLINVSPTVSPDLGLGGDNSCLGLGVSACDPITVDSDVTKTVNHEDSSDKADDSNSKSSAAPPSSTYSASSPSSAASSAGGSSDSGDSLLNLSPNASPDLSGDNSCVGIGISACDPITVDSVVNKTVSG
ncbi:hypothetical protein GGR52DRAFT_534154 [Hypoxylon sp. FL1284]|nr:hypothetical protein GGR52DRAFT_534154 [Hypoxylon sp. FL1284]